MPKRRSSSITIRGKAARSLVAGLLISSKGDKAAENTDGPMKTEIQRQQRGMFK